MYCMQCVTKPIGKSLAGTIITLKEYRNVMSERIKKVTTFKQIVPSLLEYFFLGINIMSNWETLSLSSIAKTEVVNKVLIAKTTFVNKVL